MTAFRSVIHYLQDSRDFFQIGQFAVSITKLKSHPTHLVVFSSPDTKTRGYRDFFVPSTYPPKFNIAPEKWWLEDYFPIGIVYFQGRTVKLQEGKFFGDLAANLNLTSEPDTCCFRWVAKIVAGPRQFFQIVLGV